jgi:hypothetical protein
MPQYEWFVAQEHTLTKDEYHRHLAESKIVFSANLQETLGISMYEGALVGTYPLVPDRLSYTEMWEGGSKYPSEGTLTWESYLANKERMIEVITVNMRGEILKEYALQKALTVGDKFFNGNALYKVILDSTT